MKIVFTGGGTGGHFYPIIAVAQKVNKIIDRDKILGVKLYYISDSPYDREALFQNNILYEEINNIRVPDHNHVRPMGYMKVFFLILKKVLLRDHIFLMPV